MTIKGACNCSNQPSLHILVSREAQISTQSKLALMDISHNLKILSKFWVFTCIPMNTHVPAHGREPMWLLNTPTCRTTVCQIFMELKSISQFQSEIDSNVYVSWLKNIMVLYVTHTCKPLYAQSNLI
jgi:hypothetical protein